MQISNTLFTARRKIQSRAVRRRFTYTVKFRFFNRRPSLLYTAMTVDDRSPAKGAFACVTFPCQKGRFRGAGVKLCTVSHRPPSRLREVDDIFPLLSVPRAFSFLSVHIHPFLSPNAERPPRRMHAKRIGPVASLALASFKFAVSIGPRDSPNDSYFSSRIKRRSFAGELSSAIKPDRWRCLRRNYVLLSTLEL